MDRNIAPSAVTSQGQTIILCGGGGSRLWPLSRDDRPKPFLPLFGEKCSFDLALELARRVERSPPLIMASRNAQSPVEQRLSASGQNADIILEAASCDTALAIAVAVEVVAKSSPDTILTILPSDHWIADMDACAAALTQAGVMAKQGLVAILGVPPSSADERFGYVHKGRVLADGTYGVLGFCEKPRAAEAQRLVRDGWLWNAGSVVARADTLHREIIAHVPELASEARHLVQNSIMKVSGSGTLRCLPVPRTLAQHLPRSFDMAVLERTSRAAVIELNSGWADIGTWKELWDMRKADSKNCRLSGPVQTLDCEASLLWAEGVHVTAIGLRDLTVVATRDAVLVSAMKDLAKLKPLVATLKADPDTRCLTETTPRTQKDDGSTSLLHTNNAVSVRLVHLQKGCELDVAVSAGQRHILVLTGCLTLSTGATAVNMTAGNQYIVEPGSSARLQSLGETGAELLDVSYDLSAIAGADPMASNHSAKVSQPLA